MFWLNGLTLLTSDPSTHFADSSRNHGSDFVTEKKWNKYIIRTISHSISIAFWRGSGTGSLNPHFGISQVILLQKHIEPHVPS